MSRRLRYVIAGIAVALLASILLFIYWVFFVPLKPITKSVAIASAIEELKSVCKHEGWRLSEFAKPTIGRTTEDAVGVFWIGTTKLPAWEVTYTGIGKLRNVSVVFIMNQRGYTRVYTNE